LGMVGWPSPEPRRMAPTPVPPGGRHFSPWMRRRAPGRSWLAFAAALAGTLSRTVAQEESCIPYCDFDALRTGRCHVSRAYAVGLISFFDVDGAWAGISSHLAECEAQGVAQCTVLDNCEVDENGYCTASRAWAAEKLAALPTHGGAGLDSQRCGLLGRLLSSGAECRKRGDKATCENITATSSQERCAWDSVLDTCDAAPAALPELLGSSYRPELARVSLRRAHCAAQSSSLTCTGDCQWQQTAAGAWACSLRSLDALLAVIGEDCPLRPLLRQHASCDGATSMEACAELPLRSDGLMQCSWQGGRCVANSIALEFDLVQMVGLGRPDILVQLRNAQSTCAPLNQIECNHCAPPIGPLQTGGAAAQRPVSLGTVAALSGAALLIWGRG